MRENLRLSIQICGITFIMLLIAIFAVLKFGSIQLAWSVFYGYLVSLANILFAFFSIKWAFDKPNNTFFSVVLGGMGIRFMFLLAAIFFVWEFAWFPFSGFIVSLIGFYLTLQFFEVRYIQKELNLRKVGN